MLKTVLFLLCCFGIVFPLSYYEYQSNIILCLAVYQELLNLNLIYAISFDASKYTKIIAYNYGIVMGIMLILIIKTHNTIPVMSIIDMILKIVIICLQEIHLSQNRIVGQQQQQRVVTIIPKIEYKIHQIQNQTETSDCTICLESLDKKKTVCKLDCNHKFHLECISKWNKLNLTCPICRDNIV